MHPPKLIGIFICLLLYASLADGADDDVQLVPIASDTAPMVVWPSMVSTVDFSAVLALEGHEVPLMTLGQLTVLSYLRFKHIDSRCGCKLSLVFVIIKAFIKI